MRSLEPIVVLFLLPVLIGIGAELLWRDSKNASLTATLATAFAVFACLQVRIPEETWNWLAAFLVLPLPVAFALATVFICQGRVHTRRHRPHHEH
jgi:hypothetical protein